MQYYRDLEDLTSRTQKHSIYATSENGSITCKGDQRFAGSNSTSPLKKSIIADLNWLSEGMNSK